MSLRKQWTFLVPVNRLVDAIDARIEALDIIIDTVSPEEIARFNADRRQSVTYDPLLIGGYTDPEAAMRALSVQRVLLAIESRRQLGEYRASLQAASHGDIGQEPVFSCDIDDLRFFGVTPSDESDDETTPYGKFTHRRGEFTI